MCPYENRGKLQRAERLEIAILLTKAYSLRAIAGALRRSPNTISHEVRANRDEWHVRPNKGSRKSTAEEEDVQISMEKD